MAHFAELDSNNKVLRVIVVGNDDCKTQSGKESEKVGIAFCKSLFGPDTKWVQTSYNGSMRGKYADIGDTYDSEADRFIPPSPFPSWVFDEDSYAWIAPVQYPEDGLVYKWDEATTSWVQATSPTDTPTS